MMLKFVLLLIFSGTTIAWDIHCSVNRQASCYSMKGAHELMNIEELAETEDELEERCKHYAPFLHCLKDCIDQCMRVINDYTPIMGVFPKKWDVVFRLCNKTDILRKKYIENVKCLKDHKNNRESVCGPIKSYYLVSTLKSRQNCWEPAKQLRCILNDVEATCGKAALEVEEELLRPMSYFVDRTCGGLYFQVLENMAHILHDRI